MICTGPGGMTATLWALLWTNQVRWGKIYGLFSGRIKYAEEK